MANSSDSSACSSRTASPVKADQPQQLPPQPRFPPLSLNLGGLARPDDAPHSARPPMPKLGQLGLLPQGDAGHLTARQQPMDACPPQAPLHTAAVAVGLLSPAFSLLPQPGAQHQCAERLGVAPDRLRYFALVETGSLADLPPDCTQVAVEVADSSEYCASRSRSPGTAAARLLYLLLCRALPLAAGWRDL